MFPFFVRKKLPVSHIDCFPLFTVNNCLPYLYKGIILQVLAKKNLPHSRSDHMKKRSDVIGLLMGIYTL